MSLRKLMATVTVAVTLPVLADSPLSPDQIRALTDSRTIAAITLFRSYLSLPNDAHFPDTHIEPLLIWLEQEFSKRGFDVSRIETAGSPLLLAERRSPGAEKTALIYLQADGQPVDSGAWFQESAWEPVLKRPDPAGPGGFSIIPWSSLESGIDPDWRIFARSASDSKGPNIQFLMAIENLDAAGIAPDFNLKVIIDTEEELGSPNLAAALEVNRDRLAADMLLIFDGPPHASGEPTVVFGARGTALLTLTTYGPRVPQHSGHYGNYAPNPGYHLARILASMKSPDGLVTIPGYYEGIEINDEVQAILDAVPDNEAAVNDHLAIKQPDAVGDSLQMAVQYPSLNYRGLSSGWVGEQARTIVPATATAEIDIRLVPESDPHRLIGLIAEHIEALGYVVLDHEPSREERMTHDRIVTMISRVLYAAFRTDFDSEPGTLAVGAMRHLFGKDPIRIRTSGGSIPIAPFVDTLGVPAVLIPSVNIDNNQHAPNENLRLGNFIEGISIVTAVLAEQLP